MIYPDRQEGKFGYFLFEIYFLLKRVPSAAQRGQGSLIIESKDTRDNNINDDNDDEDDNFLIQEEKPSLTKSFVN